MKAGACSTLLDDYTQRSRRYGTLGLERFPDEPKFAAWLAHLRSRSQTRAWIFDSRGKNISSEDLAKDLAAAGVDGIQNVVLAIGPADGWSEETRRSADLMLAFGRITLPHELALVVASEQLYRALTIIEGHPYHSGH